MKDRRRPGHHYSSDMCEFVDKGSITILLKIFKILK